MYLKHNTIDFHHNFEHIVNKHKRRVCIPFTIETI